MPEQTDNIEMRVRDSLHLLLGGEIGDGDIVRDDEPRWDSVKNIELLFILEDTFGITFDESDLPAFHRVSTIVKVVERRLADQQS